MAILQVVKGPNAGQRFPLAAERTILGRHPGCDIVLEVAAVSRQHARILQEQNAFFLEDLGSRNGTYINGHVVQDRMPLKEGDHVKICDMLFTFYLTEPSEMLPGLLPFALSHSSGAAVIEEEPLEKTSQSTIMSTYDVSSSRSVDMLSARPEVKLRAMVEIAQNLGKSLSVDAVLPRLLDSLFKIFVQADRGFIVLRSSEHGPLVPKAVKFRRSGDQETIRISRTIINQAMTSKQAVLSADATSDERFQMAQSIADFPIRSMMCAPLVASEDRSLGVIQIDTLNRSSRFTTDDLEVLASVASQAAVAVENAQLHEQALAQQSIQRDLQLAQKVQRGLLPNEPPRVPGYHFFSFYEAANQVGGDYYDYVLLSGGRVAVVVGDVAGKGVAAALLMAKLAGDVRYCLASERDPAAAVRRMNATFARSGSEDRFVTLVVAVLDPASHELTIVNAGHMPPLLRRMGGEVEAIGAAQTGLPLGVNDDYRYEASTRTLEPGDFLTIFTDGISEAMDSNNEQYGLERLRQQVGATAVSVAELGQHLLDDVRRFVGGRPQSDDICVACFGREEG